MSVSFEILTQIYNLPLNCTEKTVLINLIYHKNFKTGKCFPKQETMAKELAMPFRTLHYTIRDLKQKGYISTQKKGRINHYTMNLEPH